MGDGVEASVVAAVNRVISTVDRQPGQWELVSDRAKSLVLRCERNGLIAKCLRHTDAWRVRAELDAVRYAEEHLAGVAPRLVALSESDAIIVMEDLGSGPTLADRLLAESAVEATEHLLGFVDAVAAMHVRSVGSDPASQLTSFLGLRHGSTMKRLASLDFAPAASPAVLAELAGLARLVVPGPESVFTVGDLCPDNNMATQGGVRLFDLEGGGHVHPALDLAFVTVPFPSCWCAFGLPDDVVAAAIDRYRGQAGAVAPSAIERLPDAELFWAITTIAWMGPDADADGGEPMHPQLRLTRRALVLHRIRRAMLAGTAGPATSAWLQELDAVLSDRWQSAGDPPIAPAFR